MLVYTFSCCLDAAAQKGQQTVEEKNILKKRKDWLFPYLINITQQINTLND
jgi:hypothetical protein